MRSSTLHILQRHFKAKLSWETQRAAQGLGLCAGIGEEKKKPKTNQEVIQPRTEGISRVI